MLFLQLQKRRYLTLESVYRRSAWVCHRLCWLCYPFFCRYFVTGLQYVGSAYGTEGILGRWQAYAHSGHDGNLQLRELIAKNPNCVHAWQYSILTTLSQSVTRDEVIQLESLYKQKLGSRAHGLNCN